MGSFFSNISKLTLSRGLSVGLGLATTPIVARLYSPEHFGIYGLVASVATWTSAFVALGYHSAIPLASTQREMRSLTNLCLVITGILTLLAIVIFGLGSPLVANFLNEPLAAPFLWFVPALFFLDSLGPISENILAREGRFGPISVVNFLGTNCTRLFTILWALVMGAGVMGLFVGYILGGIIGVGIGVTCAARVLWKHRQEVKALPARYIQIIRQHSQFPKINLWTNLLRVSTLRIPVFALAFYFEPATVGFFTFAFSLITMPMRILGSSVAQVFYPEAAREWDESQAVKRALHFAVMFQSTVGVFPMVALGLLAPLFFETVFGFRWREAGVMCQLMSFWMLMNFLISPIQSLFLIRRKAEVLLYFSLAQLGTTALAMFLGGYLGSARLALALYSGCTGMVYAVMLVKVLHLGKASVMRNLYTLAKEIAFSLITLAPAALVYYFTGWRWIPLGLCVVGLAAYVGLLYWRDAEIRDRVMRMFRQGSDNLPEGDEGREQL